MTRTGPLLSSSSSRRATVQHPVPKKRNQRGTTDQAQVGNSVPPKRIYGAVLEDGDMEMLTSE
jgi:hypothetical protein